MAEQAIAGNRVADTREIVSLTASAQNLQERLCEANNNLQSIVRRLFTAPPDPTTEKAMPDVPEPVRSELEQLNYLMGRIDREIDRSFELGLELDRI